MPTIQRLLTDETGQSLVTAINNVVAAVKPNATEIQMSSSDTTTVATAITNINDKIGTVPSGQTVEGQITTLNSNLASRYVSGGTIDLTKISSGEIYCVRSGNVATLVFTNVIPSSEITGDVVIGTASVPPIRQTFGVLKNIIGDDVFAFVNADGNICISGITGAAQAKNIYGTIVYITAND